MCLNEKEVVVTWFFNAISDGVTSCPPTKERNDPPEVAGDPKRRSETHRHALPEQSSAQCLGNHRRAATDHGEDLCTYVVCAYK